MLYLVQRDQKVNDQVLFFTPLKINYIRYMSHSHIPDQFCNGTEFLPQTN